MHIAQGKGQGQHDRSTQCLDGNASQGHHHQNYSQQHTDAQQPLELTHGQGVTLGEALQAPVQHHQQEEDAKNTNQEHVRPLRSALLCAAELPAQQLHRRMRGLAEVLQRLQPAGSVDRDRAQQIPQLRDAAAVEVRPGTL